MPRVVYQEWWERDSWSGPSRSGYTLHKTEEDRKAYIKRYWDSMPNQVPDSYDSPEGIVSIVELPDFIYEMLMYSLEKDYGMRFYSSLSPEYVLKMLINSFRIDLVIAVNEIEAERP